MPGLCSADERPGHRRGRLHRLPPRRAARIASGIASGSSTTSPPAGARTSRPSTATSSSSRATSRATSASTTRSRGCEVVFHQAALPSVPRSIAGPADEQRHERHRHAQRPARRARRGRAARRLRLVVVGLRRQPGAAQARGHGRRCRSRPYAVAKLAGEGYCRSFGEVYGLETVALRYFNVFGPRQDPRSQYAAVIPNFITALLDGERPTIFGDGEQSRDFTYVDNVVEANLLAMARGRRRGGVYNVACGERDHAQPARRASSASSIGSDVEPVYDAAAGRRRAPLAGRPDAVATRPRLTSRGRPARGPAPLDRAPQGPLALGCRAHRALTRRRSGWSGSSRG